MSNNKIKFSMTMTESGTITATISKASDQIASIENVQEFVEKAKAYLDEFLTGCTERISQSKQVP